MVAEGSCFKDIDKPLGGKGGGTLGTDWFWIVVVVVVLVVLLIVIAVFLVLLLGIVGIGGRGISI